jgi:hypothetical protein
VLESDESSSLHNIVAIFAGLLPIQMAVDGSSRNAK